MSITLRQSLALLGTVSEGQSILGDSQDSQDSPETSRCSKLPYLIFFYPCLLSFRFVQPCIQIVNKIHTLVDVSL